MVTRTCNESDPLPHGVIWMTKVVADDLQDDEVSSLVEYLTALSGGQITQHKKIVDITGLTNKKIKFLLHKFLYTRHPPGYGVLDTAGNFEIVGIKPEEKRAEEHETLSPTMPSLYGIPHPVKPSDMIEWEGQPPWKKTRYKKQ